MVDLGQSSLSLKPLRGRGPWQRNRGRQQDELVALSLHPKLRTDGWREVVERQAHVLAVAEEPDLADVHVD